MELRINSDLMGSIAAFFFIVANAYYPAKIITRRYIGKSKEITRFFNGYLKLHIMFNLIALWLTLLHGHYADERNVILQMSMLVTVWLSIVGIAMYYKQPVGLYREMKLLHSQQAMFWVWVALIVIGHSLF
ncbi:MAG: hypothetical protein HQK89_03240 [Nitrospirae bacterium]|nr:hypothetical protein [Nitrospirota bacterium]